MIFKYWHKWRYPYLTAGLASTLFAIYLSQNPAFKDWLLHLGTLEYLGALVAGFLFVSSLTTPISIVAIGIMAENVNPFALAVVGAAGAVAGDFLIFKLVKDHLGEELAKLVGKKETSHLKLLLHSKFITWMLPIIGTLIIASPLPDELGVSLLSVSKMSERKFILISYISNAIGILMIASVAKVL